MTFFACWLLTKKCHHTTKNAFCLPFACCNLQWHEPPKELMMIILMNQTMGSIDMKNSKMTIIFLLFEDHDYRPWRILHTSSRIIFLPIPAPHWERKSVIARSPIIVYYYEKIVNAYCTVQLSLQHQAWSLKTFFLISFNTIASVLSF